MADQTMTVTLPERLFARLQARARRHQRPVEDEAARTLAQTLETDDGLPSELAAAIAALATLDDQALWHISHSQPPVEDGLVLAALVAQRQQRPLNEAEERLLAELVDRHDRVMLVRAEAVALLREHGHDVTARLVRA